MSFNQFKSTILNFDTSFSLKLGESSDFEFTNFKMIPAGSWLLGSEMLINRMIDSRDLNRNFFFQRFKPSIAGMKSYLNGPIFDDQRILFIVFSKDGEPLGHMGLKLHSPRSLEVDNLMKFESTATGLMSVSFAQMLAWSHHLFGEIQTIAQVISTNQRAINFYEDFGFKVSHKIRLKVAISAEGVASLNDCPVEESDTEVTKLIMTRDSLVSR